MKKEGVRIIYETRDMHGKIQVTEGDGFRSLHFGSTSKQSEINLASPETPALDYMRHLLAALLFCPNPRRVLVLGMGGGSIPGFLHHFFPDAIIDICELRPKVTQIARVFFKLPKSSRIRIFHADARDYLRHNLGAKYDLVFVDIFNQFGSDSALEEETFFPDLFHSLNSKGVVGINLWSSDPFRASLFKNAVLDHGLYFLKLPTDRGNIEYFAIPMHLLVRPEKLKAEEFISENSVKMQIAFRPILRRLERENRLNLSIR